MDIVHVRLEQNPPHGFTHARVFGLKLDRPPEMGQGGLRAALQSQRQTPFQLGIRGVRLHPAYLLEVFDRLGKAATGRKSGRPRDRVRRGAGRGDAGASSAGGSK